jgi:hypothetical protein
MKTLLIKEPGEICGKPEVRVGSDARENEEQGRWMVLAIEGEAQVAAPFERRQLISVWEDRHMDYLPFEPRTNVVGIQNGGRGRRDVGIVIRISIVLGSGRAP